MGQSGLTCCPFSITPFYFDLAKGKLVQNRELWYHLGVNLTGKEFGYHYKYSSILIIPDASGIILGAED